MSKSCLFVQELCDQILESRLRVLYLWAIDEYLSKMVTCRDRFSKM